MKTNPLDEAVRVIKQGQKFFITCHGKPDGDALGSSLALARALRLLGKEVLVVSQDDVPEVYSFIPESDTVVHSTTRRDFDVALVCDVQLPLRADHVEKVVQSIPVQVFIDHHPTPENMVEAQPSVERIIICDTKAAATGEMVLDVIDALGVELDQVMASQLMAAIVADTGCFRFTNVTPRTFAIASRLASLGADVSATARFVYESRSFVGTKLLGRALASLESDINGRVVWASVTQQDFKELDAADEDTESIVNLVRSIKGAAVGILFRDLGDSIRVSLRSHGNVDVKRVAEVFGGGGHKAAAGCTLHTNLEDAIKLVVAETVKCTEF